MKKNNYITSKKITALFTLACFLISCVSGQFAYAASESGSAAEIVKSSDSFIPFSVGKVAYAKNFNSKDIIVNIQDLHCHGESQRNIAAILKSLEKYGFENIYLEGAVSEISTDRFINLRGSDLGKLVVDDLLANGTLSGAEYYSIKSKKSDIIKPLDKSELYFENLFLLGSILNSQTEINAELKGLKDRIEAVKKEYYNSDLVRLDKFNREFLKGKTSAKKYYSILSKLSSKAGININAYTNVYKYIELINEKGIDYGKITEELHIFVNALKEILPYGIYYELSEKSNDFTNINELFPVFAALSDSYGICSRHNLKQLDTFFKYMKTNEDLDLLSFIAEEDKLIYDIGISLSKTTYERDIVFLDRFAKVLDGFFTAKITAGDYGYYLKNIERFNAVVSKYLGDDGFLSALMERQSLFEKYHANNIKRDDAFLSSVPFSKENVSDLAVFSSDFSDLKNLMAQADNDANIKIVITGGFHSEGLRKHFADSKTSFIIITPNVTGDIEKAENTYFSSISEYFQVFTSALNKMPLSGDPLQIALPKIVASAIHRAKINQMPLREIQNIMNDVFAGNDAGGNISATKSLYEPVNSAKVTIDSVTGDAVNFTVVYDYGFGKYPAYYVYDFKTKSVSLTADAEKVKKMYESLYHNGKEGYSAPNIFIQYGQALADKAEPVLKELERTSGSALILMDPQQLHSTVATHDSVSKEKNSPMSKALIKPLSDKELSDSKDMIGHSFLEQAVFKAALTGHFKLMPDGVIIYQFDNPEILSAIASMKKELDGKYWTTPAITHITIGRLAPGKYTPADINKINKILDRYNKSNPFADVEFNFNSVTYGMFSATGNENIKTEKLALGQLKQNGNSLQNVLPKVVLSEIKSGIAEKESLQSIENRIAQKILEGEILETYAGVNEKIIKAEVKIKDADSGKIEFTIRYFGEVGGFVESAYRYDAATSKLYNIIDEKAVRESINVFFGRTESGEYKERYSDAAMVVNNRGIADNFSTFHSELGGIVSNEKGFLLSPEFYHFTFNANRNIIPEGLILPETPADAKTLNEIENTIPQEALTALKKIKGRLEGYFALLPNGMIIYRVINPEIVKQFNGARGLFDKEKGWGYPPIVHLTVGRLFPGKNSQEDIDKINALLDKYNRDGLLKDVEYTFDNVVFGQTMSTGNGFVRVKQLNPQAKQDIAHELSFFDNATRFNLTEKAKSSAVDLADSEKYAEAENVEQMLDAIDQISRQGLGRYEFTFDALMPEYYAQKADDERKKFRRKLIPAQELYDGTKNIRDYIIRNADRIKKKAAEKNVSLSMHSYSIVSYAVNAQGKEVPINPHPGFNSQMGEIFDWQLDIAEALGIENLTVHLEDHDVDGYAVFVKKAAAKKIKVNFENHIPYTNKEAKSPDSFYYYTLLNGFISKEKFIETMLGIKERLTEEEQKYLGVTFDTSKALNSYAKTLPSDAATEEISAETAKINLKNLIEYYDAIDDAGLTINNIHLAQFSANIADVRKRTSSEFGSALVVYNKSNVDDLNNLNLDMAEFLRYLRSKNYSGAVQQETPGIITPSKNKKASILDPLFKNKNSLWYKIYSFAAAPLWEEGLFRFIPFAIAFFAGNPFVMTAAVIFSTAVFTYSHVIVKWIADKERPKLISEDNVQKVLLSMGLGFIYFVVYAVVPFAPLAAGIIGFLVSSAAHGIYNYLKDKEKHKEQQIEDELNRLLQPDTEDLSLTIADSRIKDAIQNNDAKELLFAIYGQVEGMPYGVLRGVTSAEARAILNRDPATAKLLGIENGLGFGYAEYSRSLAESFPDEDIDALIAKYTSEKGIDFFTSTLRITVHNTGNDVIIVEERDGDGIVRRIYRAGESGTVSVLQLLNNLALKGLISVYSDKNKYVVEIYDNYEGSLIVEYSLSGENSVTINALKVDRESKDGIMKGLKKLSKKELSRELDLLGIKNVIQSDLSEFSVDDTDSNIAEIKNLSDDEIREKFEKGIKLLKELYEAKAYSFYISDNVSKKLKYVLNSIEKLTPRGFDTIGHGYIGSARKNLQTIDSFEGYGTGYTFSDMLMYVAILSGASDTRRAYDNLEKLYLSIPMVSPVEFLRMASNMDLNALNENFPLITDTFSGGEYSYVEPKMALFADDGFAEFLSLQSYKLAAFLKRLNLDIVDKSFEYLIKSSFIDSGSKEDEKLTDVQMLSIFRNFFQGTKNIKRSVFSDNPQYHNINNVDTVRIAYDAVLVAAQANPKAVDLFNQMINEDLDFTLGKTKTEDFEVYADEIAQALFLYVSTAKNRYKPEIVKKMEDAIKDLTVFKGEGIEFKFLRRNFKEISAGDISGDCTAPGQVNFGKYILQWFANPDFQSLNVYIDGKFAMKFHLVIAETASSKDESKNGKRILVVDAMETSPLVRIEPKVIDEEAGFEPEMKPLEEGFSSINYSREKAFTEGLNYVRAIADKLGIENIYYCEMTNSIWMLNRVRLLRGSVKDVVKFKDMEKFQSNKQGGVVPFIFENIEKITEIDNTNNEKIKELNELYTLIEQSLSSKEKDVFVFIGLLNRYLALIEDNINSDLKNINDYSFMFLEKNKSFSRMASLLVDNREALRSFDYSSVPSKTKSEILQSIITMNKVFSKNVPERKTQVYELLAELIFLSDNFIDDFKISRSYVYNFLYTFGENFRLENMEYYLLSTDKGEYIRSVRKMLNKNIDDKQFKKIMALGYLLYFVSDYANISEGVDIENIYKIFILSQDLGIMEKNAFISEEEFLSLPENERVALFYLYMVKIFKKSDMLLGDANKKIMAQLRGFVFKNKEAFISLGKKEIIKFDTRDSYIEEITLSPKTSAEFKTFSSFNKKVSLFNRTIAAMVSIVSMGALYALNAPVILTGFAAYAACNFLFQAYMVYSAAKKAQRGNLITKDESFTVASTDGTNVKINEKVFSRLPQWYQNFVLNHESIHIKLSRIKNPLLNEIITTITDLFMLPLSMFSGRTKAEEMPEEINYSAETELKAEAEKEKKAKRRPAAVKPKQVRLYDQDLVFGQANMSGKNILEFDADVRRYMHYTPDDTVYLTSIPGGGIYLFVQFEALEAFIKREYQENKVVKETIYANTLEGSIDKSGVLKLNVPGNKRNSFSVAAGKERTFRVMGDKHGIVQIIPYEQYVKIIVDENDNTRQVIEEGVRMIEEIIRATESSMFFTADKIDIAFRFLNRDNKHMTPQLKIILESMLKEEGLNRDQKAFTLLLLTAISANEKPDLAYIKKQIKNTGSFNIDSYIIWLEMISNAASNEFFAKIIDYLQSKNTVSKYSNIVNNAFGSLTVFEQLKNSLAISANEQWLLETERAESPGEHILYGKYFMDAEMFEENIDFMKLEKLRDFGMKPVALTFGKERVRNDRDKLCYVNVDINGKQVVLESSVRMINDVPVITMIPLNFEAGMDYKEIYVKAAKEVLDRLQNDYAVKGRFAYLTGDISLFEKIINFISNESLFRMVGKEYIFDLKAVSFNGKELEGFANAVSEIYPQAVDIKKADAGIETAENDLNYYDISDNILKTKDFMFKVLKRVILKNKESESKSGTIIGEKINSKVFSMLDAADSPLASYGISGLASYFEKRMQQSDSAIMLLENISMSDLPMSADTALVDWSAVAAVRKMIAEGKITEETLKIYGNDIESVRRKSLAIAESALKEIDDTESAEFKKFINENALLKDLTASAQFAQFILMGQIKDNIGKIHNNKGKVVLSINISDAMTKNEIIQTALFWQSIGFDGVRLNFESEKLLNDNSLFSSLSSRLRSVKSDFVLMAGLSSSLPDPSVKSFIAKYSALDIVTAVDVSKLNDSLAEFKQKIWADINPLNEAYASDTSKYFEDVRKAIAFGAGYLGVAAGANVVGADGKSVHIEIMSKISEMLSINKTATPYQSYLEGYKTGLKDADELKTGLETKKLIVEELIKLQNGKALRQGVSIDENSLKQFSDFLNAEPGLIRLKFIRNSISENNPNGVYASAGYLRGLLESSLLSEFKNKNGLDATAKSELLRSLLLLDFSMPANVTAYSESEFVRKMTDDLSSMRPDEMLQTMLEENYSGQLSKDFVDYAVYIYLLKNTGASVSEIVKNINLLMQAHLSEMNFGYGMPVNSAPQSADEKWAVGQVIDVYALEEQQPKINKSVKDAINGSVNTLAFSMMLKAA